eukprot:TRINITY_DN23465_c0_g1_i1.p1 TRINITY_DN23465_c0_g1~~TRINITY_DN23465_c0_g1_i1.p1  ORF type:complete len:577 (+),score=142.11 TRINITY_DN23465_c0_g1_i1:80-1810(+)
MDEEAGLSRRGAPYPPGGLQGRLAVLCATAAAAAVVLLLGARMQAGGDGSPDLPDADTLALLREAGLSDGEVRRELGHRSIAERPYWLAVCALLAVLAVSWRVARRKRESAEAVAHSVGSEDRASFRSFRDDFVLVYVLMAAADWLQAPTAYALHSSYGFTHAENAFLFIVGFGASGLLGIVVGAAADRFGRKKLCLFYGCGYAASCLSRHSRSYGVLLAGRVLGGVCTSILWSVFESWMVSEHKRHRFPSDWIDSTFARMTAANGAAAVLSGVAAHVAVSAYGGHPVAPFDLSAVVLAAGSILVALRWPENVGQTSGSGSGGGGVTALHALRDPAVCLLGLTQSLFEAAMFAFVFMWTPALDPLDKGEIPHGLIFACFTVSLCVGATVFDAATAQQQRPEALLGYVYLVSAATMSVPALAPSGGSGRAMRVASFCVFEACVGVFWPSIGLLRSRLLPEEVRATLINVFRLPLNLVVVALLAASGKVRAEAVLGACAVLHGVCAVLNLSLEAKLRSDATTERRGSVAQELLLEAGPQLSAAQCGGSPSQELLDVSLRPDAAARSRRSPTPEPRVEQ